MQEKGVTVLTVRRLTGLFVLGVLLALALVPVLVCAQDDQIRQVDELYAKRYDRENVRKAIAIVDKVLEGTPNNYDALWRMAKLQWYLGDRSKGDDRLPLFEKGKGYAERATQANANGIDGHYWLGALIGCVGKEKGILNSLFMVPSMRKELERCLEIDAKFADAHYAMAQLLWEVPGIAGGNKKKALEEARLATVYEPGAIDHWLLYGQYASGSKAYATARMALQKAISLPDDPEDPVVSQEDKATARQELKEIEGK